MGRVLIVDDNPSTGASQEEALRGAAHQVDRVWEEYVGDCYNTVKELMLENENIIWDVLVLDVRFTTDHYGGIWVYNKLSQGGFRARWRHTIIYTRYSGGPINQATDGDQLILRVFADTAGIPYDCVVCSLSGGRDRLVEKVGEIVQTAGTNCPSCGKPE